MPPMPGMAGANPAAINQLQSATQQVAAISGLPANAQTIQSQIVGLCDQIVAQATEAQQATTSFVGMASPVLATLSAVWNSSPAQIPSLVQGIQQSAQALSTTIGNASAFVQSAQQQIGQSASQAMQLSVSLRVGGAGQSPSLITLIQAIQMLQPSVASIYSSTARLGGNIGMLMNDVGQISQPGVIGQVFLSAAQRDLLSL